MVGRRGKPPESHKKPEPPNEPNNDNTGDAAPVDYASNDWPHIPTLQDVIDRLHKREPRPKKE